ncbi:u6 snRNA-associated Sm LSm4 [Fusarium sp. NRRL 52700]|nr:u6 snRNA-associated Sm LSm4 [Fusarium sp. NRRL 52700]
MLPLGLLNAAQGHPMLVELKNGETLNGHLVSCDTWMNLTLKEVVQTSPEGDRFVRLPEVYVKGNNVRFNCTMECLPEKETDAQQIKYLRVPDEIIDQVSESQKGQQGGFRGGRGGQSRGDHSGRGDRGRGRGGRGRGRGRDFTIPHDKAQWSLRYQREEEDYQDPLVSLHGHLNYQLGRGRVDGL